MGSGTHKALAILQARKARSRVHGIVNYRPWACMVTDGEPQGEPEEVVGRASLAARTAVDTVCTEPTQVGWPASDGRWKALLTDALQAAHERVVDNDDPYGVFPS